VRRFLSNYFDLLFFHCDTKTSQDELLETAAAGFLQTRHASEHMR